MIIERNAIVTCYRMRGKWVRRLNRVPAGFVLTRAERECYRDEGQAMTLAMMMKTRGLGVKEAWEMLKKAKGEWAEVGMLRRDGELLGWRPWARSLPFGFEARSEERV